MLRASRRRSNQWLRGSKLCVLTFFPPVQNRASDEEDSENDSDRSGSCDAGLDLPPEVNDSQPDADVDELVELVPSFAAEAANRSGG